MPSLQYEKQTQGIVIGIDEAGRGPLAGPVYAAALHLPIKLAERLIKKSWKPINDSKKLTEKKRDELAEIIKATPGVYYAIASADPKEIDEHNILRATHIAMHRAAEEVAKQILAEDLFYSSELGVRSSESFFCPSLMGVEIISASSPNSELRTPNSELDKNSELRTPNSELDKNSELRTPNSELDKNSEQMFRILVDGLPVPTLPFPSQNIIKGDSKSLFIAAASILAKTARDAYCLEMDKKYPEYGFAKHKGYGTKTHLEALSKHGPCPEHRLSFAPVAAALSAAAKAES